MSKILTFVSRIKEFLNGGRVQLTVYKLFVIKTKFNLKQLNLNRNKIDYTQKPHDIRYVPPNSTTGAGERK